MDQTASQFPETIPTNPKDSIPSSMTLDTWVQQNNIALNWQSTNWSGASSNNQVTFFEVFLIIDNL